MKTKAVLTLPLIFFFIAPAPASAAEEYKRYVYNNDGTYQQAGESSKSSETYEGGGVGFIAGGFGYASSDDLDSDNTVWAIRGSYGTTFSNGAAFQYNGNFEYYNGDANDGYSGASSLHLAYYEPDSFAIGAFLSGKVFGSEGYSNTLDDGAIGAEAAFMSGPFTVQARAGYAESGVDGWGLNGYMLQGEARYYATPNLRFDLGASYFDFDFYSETSLTGTVNYRFESQPISLYASYEYATRDYDFVDFSANSVSAGLRWHFNSDSLLEEERRGAFWSEVY